MFGDGDAHTTHKYNLPAETLIDPDGFLGMVPEDFKKYFELTEEERLGVELLTETGDIVAKIPQEVQVKNRDITGGLPRVAALFEARKPKRAAVLATVSGFVRLAKETKRNKVLGIILCLKLVLLMQKR